MLMETVFSHNLSDEENASLFFEIKTEEQYLAKLKNDERIWHLARLFEIRKQPTKAKEYWIQIPELWQEYRLGFDDVILPR